MNSLKGVETPMKKEEERIQSILHEESRSTRATILYYVMN